PFAEVFSPTVALPIGNYAPISSWQSDSKPFGNTNCQPKHRVKSAIADVMFRRNITHLVYRN
ncbi:MAG: hypothetical protein LBI18_00925, partial [Planctomycetaceae bacterium]|nr:hypothetical protein [Planctomycetaceae bacterium]